MDWITHDEDVWWEFRGSHPNQLTEGRFYKGTVDGYADFGVFIDLTDGVTGLLHRSELDTRLESLDWEPGDEVFVQVKAVRDNGNVDLAWSIRQREDEFRGARIHDPSGDRDGEPIETDETSGRTVKKTPKTDDGDDGATGGGDAPGGDGESETDAGASETDASGAPEADDASGTTDASSSPEADGADDADDDRGGVKAAAGAGAGGAATVAETETETETETDLAEEPEPSGDRERTPIADLSDRVGETVSVEAEVVGARQTGGPTVFELRDESGVVDAAAFVEAGVRAYPDVEVGDAVRLSGEVEIRRDELQVETEALSVLTDGEREAVERRLADALSEKARPAEVTPLADHEGVADLRERIADAAEVVRRAVLATRPVVVRHPATADGYVAGAALERAVLPLVREEHARADAEYHYFDRRPLEGAVYDMDDATNDATRMLQDRDRHDEPLPLVVLLGSGSTVESADGLGLLSVYGAEQVVVDAATADPEVDEGATVVNPDLEGVDADDLSTGALAANLAAAVNAEVRDDLEHLPAVSYWEDTPEAYVDLAADAGYDEARVRDLREAVALEAYYQSYEDKRELITDILFSGEGGLAGHVAEQFREKLGAEVETAEANLERHETGGVRFAVLDADAYTHRFDFPPTPLLLDELHRRNRDGEAFVTVGIGTDELYVRTTGDVDLRAVADRASEIAPGAGIAVASLRDGRLEFLSGARDDVRDAVVAALAESF